MLRMHPLSLHRYDKSLYKKKSQNIFGEYFIRKLSLEVKSKSQWRNYT